MLVFIALIIFISIRKILKITVDKALLALRSLQTKVVDNDILVQQPNKTVKNIFTALKIIMPTNLEI